MKTYDPNTFAPSLAKEHRQWVQSVNEGLNGNVDMGTPISNAPSTSGVNAGVYTQFNRGNGSGVLVRIAAEGITDSGAPYNWGASLTGIPINHGLGRQPIGFHVVDSDGQIQVYRTAPPTNQLITLAPSDNTKSVTVYIF
jgi:hypothetical protein